MNLKLTSAQKGMAVLVCALALAPNLASAQIKVGDNPTQKVPGARLQVDGDATTTTPAKLIVTGTGNTGIGTAAPGTTLDVNGAITNRETAVAVAANAATVPANVSQVQLTGAATANVAVTAPAAPNAGQRLIVYNNTTGGFAATLNSIAIPAGQAMEFVYSNGGWRGTSAPAAGASVNLYNTDGTLTGNRVVTQGANTLAFTGTTVNAFSVDGTTLSVDAANNRVGIGTATPHAALHMNPTGSRTIVLYEAADNDHQFLGFGVNSDMLRYQTNALTSDHVFFAGTSTTTSNELMRIKGSGNVGIATTAPGTKLDVNGAITNRETAVAVAANAATVPANVSQVQLTGAATANVAVTAPAAPNAGQRLIIYNNTTGGFPAVLNSVPIPMGQAMEFAYSNGNWRGTNGGATAITPNSFWNTIGNTGTNAATNFVGTTDNADFVTRTNNAERMRVTAAGNVGIGTNAPVANLDVIAGTVGFRNAGIGTWDNLWFNIDPNAPSINASGAEGGLQFKVGTNATGTYGNGQTLSTVATMLANGNVGIGTTTPGQRLSVSDPNTGTAVTVSLIQPNLGVGSSNYIKFGRAFGNNDVADISFTNAGAGSTENALSFGFSGNPTSVATFKANGNAGIGTSAPAQKLHVEGTARITGSSGTPTAIMGRNASGDIGNLSLGVGLTLAANGTLSANSLLGNAGEATDMMRIGINNCGSFCGQGVARSLVFYNNNGEATAPIGSINFVPSTNPNQAEGTSIVTIDRDIANSSAGLDFRTRNTTTSGMDSRLTIRSGGNVGIGTTAPDQLLTVNGNASKAAGGTAWAVFSDKRLKKDIHPFTDGLQQVMQIKPVFFKYNGKGGLNPSEKDEIGIIAQEMQQIAPYAVTQTDRKIDESGKGALQFDRAESVTYMLVNAVKEQQAMIEKQQQLIEKLSEQNTRLTAEVEVIKKEVNTGKYSVK